MNPEQFNDMMKLLVQIEFNTREKKKNVDISIIAAIRNTLYYQLGAKTDWGRSEVKSIFEAAVESVIEK